MKKLIILFALLLITNFAFAITDTNLIAYYTLNESSGNAIDSKNDYDLTNTGVAYSQTGILNNAYLYNGTDYSTIASTLGATASGAKSVSLWIKLGSTTQTDYIQMAGWDFSSSTNNYGYYLQYHPVATAGLKIGTYGATSGTIETLANLGTANWHHIVFTYDGANTFAYLDGVYKATGTFDPTNLGNFMLGSDSDASNIYLDEISVWDKNLNFTEITELYNSGNALEYPFKTNAHFDYNRVTSTEYLYDTSTPIFGATITNWLWEVDGTPISINPNTSFTVTSYTDYNVCLTVTDSLLNTDSTCQTISITDITPPVTTFSSFQVPNTTDQNILLSCQDNNTGCKAVNYKIDSSAWNTTYFFGVTDTNLISYYKFDETSGSTTFDSKGTNNGTITGATINQTGKINRAYDFNTVTNKIVINDSATLKESSNVAISFWLYLYAVGSDAVIFSKGTGTDASINGLRIATSNKVMYLTDAGTNRLTYDYTSKIGGWHFIVIDSNSTGSYLFIDGVLATTGTTFGTLFNNAGNLQIGDPAYSMYSHADSFNGRLDEFAIWDKALTQEQITTLYNGGAGRSYNPTTSINFLYTGTGDHNIQYFSTDNSDNTETTKNSNFTTYGNGRFRIKDQNSGLDLNGTQINFNGSDYVSGSNVYDFNLQELTATNTPYLFTISKTGYSTRYYQIDLNYFSEFDTNFALLPDSLDSDVPFKVYKTDETTIFSNTYVEVKDSDTNWTVGRLKTSSTGEATFNLRTDDSNYISIVNNGEFTYSPVTVTVLYPKNEETLAQITEKWKIEITQNLYASYSDLNANKIIYLLPNTALPYNIKISDMNGNYFPRTYAKIYPGNPLTDTLQPYLINTTTGLLTTIRSVSAYTNQPVPNITVKIYKFISGQGRTYVEQILTDAKGEALTYAVLGAAYEYEIYSGATLIRIDAITATSSTVYIRIDDETYTSPIYQGGLFSVNFNPSKGTLSSFDKNLIQTISIFDLNSTITISNVILEIINTSINGTDGNDAIIYSLVIPYTDQNSITNNFDINSTSKIIEGVPYDTNGFIIIKVIIQTSDGNFVAFQTYKPFTGVNPLFDAGFGSRNFFGCDSYYDAQGNPNPLIPCPNQLFLALIISFILIAGFSFEMQFTNPTGLGLMFLLIMGFFTFITWIPIILYGLMVAGSIVIIIAARGRFT